MQAQFQNRTQDLETLVQLGTALWVAPAEARPVVIETLSAVSLLELSEERAMDRAIAILLKRAQSQGALEATRTGLSTGQFGNSFFQLSPSERFVLVGLHSGRWSYTRLARIMGVSAADIEVIAWRGRRTLGLEQGIMSAGPKALGPACPEYDFERPWTQRFLDDEIPGGRERIFLQNHLMACEVCRLALARCRDLHFNAEKMMPTITGDEKLSLVQELMSIQLKGLVFRRGTAVTWRLAFMAFIRQRDVQFVGAVAFALLLYLRFR